MLRSPPDPDLDPVLDLGAAVVPALGTEVPVARLVWGGGLADDETEAAEVADLLVDISPPKDASREVGGGLRREAEGPSALLTEAGLAFDSRFLTGFPSRSSCR